MEEWGLREKLVILKSPSWVKNINVKVPETQCISNKTNLKITIPRHTTLKLRKIENCENRKEQSHKSSA